MNIEDESLTYEIFDESDNEKEDSKQETFDISNCKIYLNLELNDEFIAAATVASFLRVVYASIRFSPEPSLTKQNLNQVIEHEIFKRITVLCYKAGWTTGNVGLKYLRIVRSIIEQDDLLDDINEDETDNQSKKKKKKIKGVSIKFLKDKLFFYEVVSRAIQQILN